MTAKKLIERMCVGTDWGAKWEIIWEDKTRAVLRRKGHRYWAGRGNRNYSSTRWVLVNPAAVLDRTGTRALDAALLRAEVEGRLTRKTLLEWGGQELVSAVKANLLKIAKAKKDAKAVRAISLRVAAMRQRSVLEVPAAGSCLPQEAACRKAKMTVVMIGEICPDCARESARKKISLFDAGRTCRECWRSGVVNQRWVKAKDFMDGLFDGEYYGADIKDARDHVVGQYEIDRFVERIANERHRD